MASKRDILRSIQEIRVAKTEIVEIRCSNVTIDFLVPIDVPEGQIFLTIS